MRRLAFAVPALLLLAAPACTIYWGGDDDIICPELDQAGAPQPGLLNPWNLQCEYFGGGGCGGCGACDLAEADAIALPSWGSCASSCIGLDELQCAWTPACRTVYDDTCLLTDGPCPALTPFMGCFPVDETGPVQGECVGLDAWECSRHDDCLATYSPDASGVPQFVQCARELLFECPPNADCG
jgi:hypothetical protein